MHDVTEERDRGNRKALHTMLSEPAHQRWIDACADNYVSATAVIEMMSHHLDEILTSEMVHKARKLDNTRRSRKKAKRRGKVGE